MSMRGERAPGSGVPLPSILRTYIALRAKQVALAGDLSDRKKALHALIVDPRTLRRTIVDALAEYVALLMMKAGRREYVTEDGAVSARCDDRGLFVAVRDDCDIRAAAADVLSVGWHGLVT